MNQTPNHGSTPAVASPPTDATQHDDLVAFFQFSSHLYSTPVDFPVAPTVDEGRHTLTVGDAVRRGREQGYERTPRKWQEDSKRGIVDAVKRRVGDQEAWFMNEASVRDRLASLIDRASVHRSAPASPSPRPDAATESDRTQRPAETVAPTAPPTDGGRRISDAALDEIDAFEMPDEPLLLKRYIYKQRNRLELAKMKEEQLGNALVDQREEVKSMREFLTGERGIVGIMSEAISRLGLGPGGRREEDDRR